MESLHQFYMFQLTTTNIILKIIKIQVFIICFKKYTILKTL